MPITAKPAVAQNNVAFTIKPQMAKPKKPAGVQPPATAKPAYLQASANASCCLHVLVCPHWYDTGTSYAELPLGGCHALHGIDPGYGHAQINPVGLVIIRET